MIRRTFSILIGSCLLVAAQDLARQGKGIITTIAGVDSVFDGDGKPAKDVALAGPLSIASAGDGSFYIGADGNAMIFHVDAQGVLRIAAGTGIRADTGDGCDDPRLASIDGVLAIAVHSHNKVTFATRTQIRQLSGNCITTLTKSAHGFTTPRLAALPDGSVYLGGRGGRRVLRRIYPDGNEDKIAGADQSDAKFTPDGEVARNSPIGEVDGMAVDSLGRLLFIEETATAAGTLFAGSASWLRRIDLQGRYNLRTNLRSGKISGLAVGSLDASYFFLRDGFVYLVQGLREERLDISAGPASAVAFDPKLCAGVGVGPRLGCAGAPPRAATAESASGQAKAARFLRPSGLAFDPVRRALYVGDDRALRIHRVSALGQIDRYAGGGSLGDGAPGYLANIASAAPLSAGPSSNLWIGGFPMRVVNSAGHITSAPLNALFTDVTAIHAASDTFLYFAATNSDGRGRSAGIWRRRQGMEPERLAGNGLRYDGPRRYDGTFPALQELLPLGEIKALHAHVDGRVLFSDSAHTHILDTKAGTVKTRLVNVSANSLVWTGQDSFAYSRVSEVRPQQSDAYSRVSEVCLQQSETASIRIAGGGAGNERGDGGPAINAVLREAGAIVFDTENNLYIADPADARVRKVLARPPEFRVDPSNILKFEAHADGLPSSVQHLLVNAFHGEGQTLSGVSFQARATERWLRVDVVSGQTPRLIGVVADPSGLAPGVHSARVEISMPFAKPPTRTVEVLFKVGEKENPKLSLDRNETVLSIPSNGKGVEYVTARNIGGGSLKLTYTVKTLGVFPGWLKVEMATSTITPQSPLRIALHADAEDRPAGVYSGLVVFSAGDDHLELAVTMSITSNRQRLKLSQQALSFTVVHNGGTAPPQEFSVLNLGTGPMDFVVRHQTGDNQDWLRATARKTPGNGGVVGSVEVKIDASALTEKTYSGLITVYSKDAPNGPHFVPVYLRVLAAESMPPPIAVPSQLTFLYRQGAPAARQLQIYGLTGKTVGVRLSSSLSDVRLLPTDAIIEGGQPLRVLVQPLSPNPASGVIWVQFDDGRFVQVPVETGDGFTATAPAVGKNAARAAEHAPCSGALRPTLTTLGPGFQVPGAWPAQLRVELFDACGNKVKKGEATVIATFTNGDPPLTFETEIADGIFEETWWIGQTAAKLTITLTATSPNRAVGSIEISGGQDDALNKPEIKPFTPPGRVFAAGGVLVLDGFRLASGSPQKPKPPYPWQLATASVEIPTTDPQGTAYAKLVSAEEGRIELLIPFNALVGTDIQIVADRGKTWSNPATITIAAAQPEIRSLKPVDGTLIIRCTGLGRVHATKDELKDGASATRPFEVIAEVSVTINGVRADVTKKEMVADGTTVGQYVVHATIPEGGMAAGARVVVTAANRSDEKTFPFPATNVP